MESKKEGGLEMEIKEIARQNFGRWAKALLTKDPKKVAEIYANDCTFLPTMSPEFMRGRKNAQGYFEHFLARSPEGAIRDEEAKSLGEFYYEHSGLYDFEVSEDDKRMAIECRFTFIWHSEPDGIWRIVHHHSSVKPKGH